MELEQRFSPTPEGVRAARHFVQAALDDIDPDVCDTAVLLTSELATNAILHARTEFDVAVARLDMPPSSSPTVAHWLR